MWNWLISALASKASIVLFDGSPMYKKEDLLLKIANQENITLFGVSAKYIDTLRKTTLNFKKKFKLPKLRTICSTGSPLSEDSFKYVYTNIIKCNNCIKCEKCKNEMMNWEMKNIKNISDPHLCDKCLTPLNN